MKKAVNIEFDLNSKLLASIYHDMKQQTDAQFHQICFTDEDSRKRKTDDSIKRRVYGKM